MCLWHCPPPPAVTPPAIVRPGNGAQAPLLSAMRRLSTGQEGIVSSGLNIRLRAVRDQAMTLGAQGGLYWRSRQIDAYLTRHGAQLSAVFNFAPLVLHGSVLLPSIARIAPDVRLSVDRRSMTQVLATYRIEHGAHLVAVTPTWRTWLTMPQHAPDLRQVPVALLPKNARERKDWHRWVAAGWNAGLGQADSEFKDRVRRLRARYLGMLRFLRLADAGVVSVPRVGEGRYGIQVGRRVLHDGVRIFRVTAEPRFLAEQAWRAPVLSVSPGARR
ncbi:MAG: type IV secretory system conjugative DNA transfer family protein [Acidiferrobacteraceae bacterium]